MIVSPKKFNAKILLLGEYTVTIGSGALAVPYNAYGGCWSQDRFVESDFGGLSKLMAHVESNPHLVNIYNTATFYNDLNAGLFFDSNIPHGYGLGSSGALVAAFYDAYAYQKTEELHDLKSILAFTECAFHGTSSGIDPLVSYVDKPLLYRGENLHVPDCSLDLGSFFLLDSGKPRDTGQLVRQFREKLESSSSFRKIITKLSDYNDEAIEVLIQHDQAALFEYMGKISHLQFEHFQPMIPNELLEIWKKGLDTGDYLLKLCGAGGGGMMMGLRLQGSESPEYLDAYSPISLV